MKRANYLIPRIADIDNLRLAFWKARKGKDDSVDVMFFRSDLDNWLLDLSDQLRNGEVEFGDYHYFRIYDPKERQICASAFSERVVQHALMNECHEYFERVQVFDSYASRRGKGTYAAIDRAKCYTKRYSWFLKLDVQSFFASIDHEVLKKQLRRLFKEGQLLAIFDQIIDSYNKDSRKGLPIGNLTSQYFANHYLTGLDHLIKEKWKIKAYVRYMDDMVLWSHEKEDLVEVLKHVDQFVENTLKCKLKTPVLNRTTIGVPFLGYKIYPFKMKLGSRAKKRFKKKLQVLSYHYSSGKWPEEICQRKLLPLLAFTMHAEARDFRHRILSEINKKEN